MLEAFRHRNKLLPRKDLVINTTENHFFQENYEVKGDTGLGQSSIPRKARIARTNKVHNALRLSSSLKR